MLTYLEILPDDIINLIQEHKAAIIIQEQVFKIFYKTFGPTWKQDIKVPHLPLDVYDYDYFSYMNDIMDPWHDYTDHEDLQYPDSP